MEYIEHVGHRQAKDKIEDVMIFRAWIVRGKGLSYLFCPYLTVYSTLEYLSSWVRTTLRPYGKRYPQVGASVSTNQGPVPRLSAAGGLGWLGMYLSNKKRSLSRAFFQSCDNISQAAVRSYL